MSRRWPIVPQPAPVAVKYGLIRSSAFSLAGQSVMRVPKNDEPPVREDRRFGSGLGLRYGRAGGTGRVQVAWIGLA